MGSLYGLGLDQDGVKEGCELHWDDDLLVWNCFFGLGI